MKYNYPIKYTAMPIVEQVGWHHGLNELERKYDVVCYIVSRCYVLSDKTKYKENGIIEKEYEVAFPYQGQYFKWERISPSLNLNFVKEVFDSYEEALEDVTKKNKELCKNTWVYLPYTDDFDNQVSKKIEEFNDKLSKYKMLEQQILINTSDLEQLNIKKLDNLIISDNGITKILSCSLYEGLHLFSYSNFIVYSLLQEEYDNLISLINNSVIFNVSKVVENFTPILFHKAEDENTMVLDQNGFILYYINKSEHLIDNDKQRISPIKLNPKDDKTQIIFTTETLDDIVLSFKDYDYIDLNNENRLILKK